MKSQGATLPSQPIHSQLRCSNNRSNYSTYQHPDGRLEDDRSLPQTRAFATFQIENHTKICLMVQKIFTLKGKKENEEFFQPCLNLYHRNFAPNIVFIYSSNSS